MQDAATQDPAAQGPGDTLAEEQTGPEPALAEQSSRGELELRDRAVGRLVVMAAAEVDGVAGPVTRVLGQKLGSADLDGHVKAEVELSGQVATVTVRLSVLWPLPITEVADQVRQRVRQRLDELAGLRVAHVDVQVTSLPTDGCTRRRVQ